MLASHETIVTALVELSRTVPHVSVLRGEGLPERAPAKGLPKPRDHKPDKPGITCQTKS